MNTRKIIPQVIGQVKQTQYFLRAWYNPPARPKPRLDWISLSRIIVSLDLETTGLDPQRDAILEIGAIKFRDDEVLDQFSTLINPARSIPPKITEITGLRDAYVT